ncbi:HPr family phosphocarrier protein [Agaribacter marinus]|uniref:Phosphate ABC transporter permease n=1 Tax=Agaribacter marinus TaxID=1431249 RepID=A0AA37T2N7_9ALTE|nr:HPr family phosphocarrier protein [Agaribacter marinus]GLR72840.1 phosphate ABC transporter permease [Agaribacter marinus]
MKLERPVTIVNKLGLHARAATKLVELANMHTAEITLVHGDNEAPANSVLALMMLESSQGKTVNIICEGKDAESAMAAVVSLIENKFNEDE